MNFRFSSRCSFGHATPTNSTIRFGGVVREAPVGFEERDDAVVVGRKVMYWVWSNP